MMAQPTVAVAQSNGIAALPQPESPQSASSVPSKRKRDTSADSGADDKAKTNAASSSDAKSGVVGVPKAKDDSALIRNYVEELRSLDNSSSILTTRIPEQAPSHDEPDPKRQKSDEGIAAGPVATITQKVADGAYNTLDNVYADIRRVVKDRIAEIRSAASSNDNDVLATEDAISDMLKFEEAARALFRREINYPRGASDAGRSLPPDPTQTLQSSLMDNMILTIYNTTPHGKPVFTSLPQKALTKEQRELIHRQLRENGLAPGITTTRVMQSPSTHKNKSSRVPTLGELFPAPRNLPPLQPPKAPKSTTRGNNLGFYHPEVVEKSKYRSGSYFSQSISGGHWLDYSHATPSTPAKMKQRERAQSLAGVKPSTVELEISEMEALFRGAFSSFAPAKDDSAAMVSSGQLGRMWFQRNGWRQMDRLAQAYEVAGEDQEPEESGSAMELDEDLIEDAINNWDDSVLDPTLEEALGQPKSDEEKDTDSILQEVSDLIETLISYQRNRNLSLPTSQNRHSADPVTGDMLSNGSNAQPSSEEVATYEALKAQLVLIITSLPPFAVARLNSDKLEDLNVSTRIPVRTEVYKTVRDEDEPTARAARSQAAIATTNSPRAPSHRQPSLSAGVPYQYSAQYGAQHRQSMPLPPQYPQTPVRPPPPNMSRPGTGPLPPQYQQQSRPSPGYRPPSNGYGYAAQITKAQPPYGHTNLTQYAAPQGQHRPPPHPGYSNSPQSMPPGPRYGAYPSGYQARQPGMPPQQGVYPYTNGTPMQQRPMAQPQPQPQPQPHYSQHAPMQQQAQPQYGTPHGVQRHYSAGNTAAMPSPTTNRPQVGPTGYHTVMGSTQQQQLIEQAQAKARATAHEKTMGFTDKISQPGPGGGPGVHGLAGIGLGGPPTRPGVGPGMNMSPSPKTAMAGLGTPSSGQPNGLPSRQGSSASPGPAPQYQPKPSA